MTSAVANGEEYKMSAGESGLSAMLGTMLPPWGVSLVTNLGLYFMLVAIGYLVINQVRKHPLANTDRSLYARAARFFVFGYDDHFYQMVGTDEGAAVPESAQPEPKPEPTLAVKALLLSFCTTGLLGSYLLWGVLQEKIVTTEYAEGNFESSIFLVFCNRLLALSVAIVVCKLTKQPPLRAPHYKYSFTSLSNVLSSWCQLEALKYISFPTQVLAKSSKLIPVMLMGKLISKKSYPMYDYVVAVVIGFGVTVFTLSSKEGGGDDKSTTFSGVLLIVGYLTFDSFTSQWQGHLFKEYKMSSYQMMLGVNSFSCFFSLMSLLESGELFTSLARLMADPILATHILVFSTAGATGQMFIFYTIKTFGPLVFTMIMTTRQLVSIVLSTILFGHSMNMNSLLGGLIVFSAVGYRIYKQQQGRPRAVTEKVSELPTTSTKQ